MTSYQPIGTTKRMNSPLSGNCFTCKAHVYVGDPILLWTHNESKERRVYGVLCKDRHPKRFYGNKPATKPAVVRKPATKPATKPKPSITARKTSSPPELSPELTAEIASLLKQAEMPVIASFTTAKPAQQAQPAARKPSTITLEDFVRAFSKSGALMTIKWEA
jgi:hypothetical protein